MNERDEAIVEKRAKLFVNGRSQAVRLPKEFRFEGTEVRIRRTFGGVILEEITDADAERKPWRSLSELYARFDEIGGSPIFPEGREQPEMQERDWSSFE